MRAHVLSLCLLACTPLVTNGAVTLLSAGRIVTGGETFSGFGPFSESRTTSVSVATPAFPDGLAKLSAAQTSDISATSISFSSNININFTNAAPTATATSYSVMIVNFEVIGSQQIEFTWTQGLGVYPTLSGTTFGSISLFSHGTTFFQTLPAGTYTLYAGDNSTVLPFPPGFNWSQSGTLRFIPAPTPALAALVICTAAISRRRRCRG